MPVYIFQNLIATSIIFLWSNLSVYSCLSICWNIYWGVINLWLCMCFLTYVFWWRGLFIFIHTWFYLWYIMYSWEFHLKLHQMLLSLGSHIARFAPWPCCNKSFDSCIFLYSTDPFAHSFTLFVWIRLCILYYSLIPSVITLRHRCSTTKTVIT